MSSLSGNMEDYDEKRSRIHHLEDENLSLRLRVVALEAALEERSRGRKKESDYQGLSISSPIAHNDDDLPEVGVSSPSPPVRGTTKQRVTVVPEVVIDPNRVKQLRQTVRVKHEEEPARLQAHNIITVKQEPEGIVSLTSKSEINEYLSRVLPDEKKIKIEEKAPRLSLDAISGRLALINYSAFVVGLNENIRDVPVSRSYVSDKWGGNPVDTFPKIKPSRVRSHGLDDFMFLNLGFNPYAPKIPGDPGLFFDQGSDDGSMVELRRTRRVFVRLDRSKWLYMGQYDMAPAPPLSVEEWKAQSNVMRRTWTERCAAENCQWGRETRIVVALWNRLNRKPTQQEVKRELGTNNKHTEITADELMRAFNNGIISILVWCMKCVGYCEGFQETIARELPYWVPPPPKVKGAKKSASKVSGSGNSTQPPKRPTVGQKRKRDVSMESSLSTESEEIQPGGRGPDLRYVPRGTHSRPHSSKVRTELSVEL